MRDKNSHTQGALLRSIIMKLCSCTDDVERLQWASCRKLTGACDVKLWCCVKPAVFSPTVVVAGSLLHSCVMAMWAGLTTKTDEQKRAVTELLQLVGNKQSSTLSWDRRKEALMIGTHGLLSARAKKGLEFNTLYWKNLVGWHDVRSQVCCLVVSDRSHMHCPEGRVSR